MSTSTRECGIAARCSADIQLRIASTREEREAVFELVYSAYQSAGLCQANAEELRFTPYQILPTTDILFAQHQDEVICTLSLVHDGELGLPMEDLYAKQVEERRAAGLHLAEVSCLADRRNDPARFFEMFCDLSRLMVQLAEKQAVDQLLITVHPRHAPLYMRYMGFQRIGERRDYQTVNGNPAIPLCLDLHQIQTNKPRSWEKFFGEKIAEQHLQASPITPADRDYFLRLLEETPDSPKQSSLEIYGTEETEDFQGDFEQVNEMLCAC